MAQELKSLKKLELWELGGSEPPENRVQPELAISTIQIFELLTLDLWELGVRSPPKTKLSVKWQFREFNVLNS